MARASERDGLAGEAVGVAAAVEALVMVAHAGDELLVEERAHDLGADAGVLAYELPLLGGQSGPALSRTRSEMPILPMSCRKATFCSSSRRSSGQSSSRPSKAM